MSLIVLASFVGACASTGGTDPTNIGFRDSISFKAGKNEKLNSKLTDMKSRTDQLNSELTTARSNMGKSQAHIDNILQRLNKVQVKEEASNSKKNKVEAELQLAKQDLNTHQQELKSLEEKVEGLKATKTSKIETEARLVQAERELDKTKASIALLLEHIESDLILEAENVLEYDD